VTPDEEAEMIADLIKAARADKRAEAAKERARLTLREAILKAAAAGMGTTKITRAIEHRYAEGHVSRIVNGKA